MKCLFLLLGVCVWGVCGENKVLVDWLVGVQMKKMGAALAATGKTSVQLGDWDLGDVVARGVTLGDLSTLAGRGHSYLWVPRENTIQAVGFVGLDNMTLTVESLTVANKTFAARFTVAADTLTFTQKTLFYEDRCEMTFSDVLITGVEGVEVFSDVPEFDHADVTQFVKVKVVPFVNRKMQEKSFLDLVNKYLDTCNYMRAF